MTEDEYFSSQNELYQQIAKTLIQNTPENWSQILLTLEHEEDDLEGSSLEHMLENPEIRNSSIMPPDELYEYTFSLFDLFKNHEKAFKKALIKVYEVEGKWKIETNYEY